MDYFVELLRRISIEKRLKFAFISLCLVPVFLVSVINTGLEVYYLSRNEQMNFENFAYESQVRIGDSFEQLTNKFEYLKDNNDLLTDLYLYQFNPEYKTELVEKRIVDTIASIVSTQEEIEYTQILLDEGDSFLYGNAIIDKELISSLSGKEAGWYHFEFGTKQIMCIVEPVQIQYNREESATFILFVNMAYLEALCKEAAGLDIQSIAILDEDGQVMAGAIADDRSGYHTVATPIKGTGFSVVSSFATSPFRLDGLITTLIVAMLVTLAAWIMLMLIQASITVPMKQLLKRISETFEDGEDAAGSGSNPPEIVCGDIRDEHELLNREFDAMLLRLHGLIEDVYNTKINENELKIKIREWELNALQQQINPHFLYNLLDNLFWISQMKGYGEIGEMITALGEFFKTSVSEKGAFVPIRTEIENVSSYIRLQKIMHKDQFDVFWNVDEEMLGYKTVKLILQPVIENSIIHGFEGMDSGGEVRISGQIVESVIQFLIEDNGQGMTQDQCDELAQRMNSEVGDVKGSIGMKNVNQRIKIYFGKEFGISIMPNTGKGTTVMIRIPIKA